MVSQLVEGIDQGGSHTSHALSGSLEKFDEPIIRETSILGPLQPAKRPFLGFSRHIHGPLADTLEELIDRDVVWGNTS
jgi:hypothetical protein